MDMGNGNLKKKQQKKSKVQTTLCQANKIQKREKK